MHIIRVIMCILTEMQWLSKANLFRWIINWISLKSKCISLQFSLQHSVQCSILYVDPLDQQFMNEMMYKMQHHSNGFVRSGNSIQMPLFQKRNFNVQFKIRLFIIIFRWIKPFLGNCVPKKLSENFCRFKMNAFYFWMLKTRLLILCTETSINYMVSTATAIRVQISMKNGTDTLRLWSERQFCGAICA